MSKKLLITGGAGFIGSNFIHYILNKYPDYIIVNLDKLTYAGNLTNLKDIEKNSNYSFIKGNICDKSTVKKAMNDCDLVVNFAAETHVDRSIMNAGVFIQTDVFGTFVLLEAAKENKIEKFVHISTDEVYGSIEKGSFKETDPLYPSNPYSASKSGADRLAYSYWVTYNLPVSIIRSSNNYGPYQYPEKVIPLFITNALQNKQLPVYGDGKNVRDWIHVMDNCSAIDLVLHKGRKGEVYNAGGDNEVKNIDMTRLILEYLGKPKSLLQFVTDRMGHDRRYSLDCSKIKNELSWKPQISFKSGLQETIEWYKKNAWWWRPLVK